MFYIFATELCMLRVKYFDFSVEYRFLKWISLAKTDFIYNAMV